MERLVLFISYALHSSFQLEVSESDNCPTVCAHMYGLYSAVGVNLQPGGGMAHWLLETQLRSAHDKEAQRQRAAAELEMERRKILDAMRHRQPEMGGCGPCTSTSLANLKTLIISHYRTNEHLLNLM